MSNLPEYKSIFRLIPDEDYLKFLVFDPSEGIKGRYVSRFLILKCWQLFNKIRDNQQAFDFFLSIMILMVADPSLREVLKRKTAQRTRNIDLNVDTVRNYLKDAMTIEKKDDPLSPESLDLILEKAFLTLRKELGFPEKNLFEYSYKITDELIASIDKGKCRDLLIQQQSDGFLYKNELEKILKLLKGECPSNWEKIYSAIKDTSTTNQLSAISINTEGEEIFIHIVNPHGKHIKMEAWKFLLLIDNSRSPRQLFDFDKLRFRDPPPLFVFNNCKVGKVEGMFDPKTSSLNVICYKDENIHEREDTAVFIIDITYTLCLYAALKKLKRDKIRFTELRERAETAIADQGIFDNLNKRNY